MVEEGLEAGEQEHKSGVEVAFPQRSIIIPHETQEETVVENKRINTGGSLFCTYSFFLCLTWKCFVIISKSDFLHLCGFPWKVVTDTNHCRQTANHCCQHNLIYPVQSGIIGLSLCALTQWLSVVAVAAGRLSPRRVARVAQQRWACGRAALTLGRRLPYCGPVCISAI